MGGWELEVKICKNLEKSGLGLCHETGVKSGVKTRVKTHGKTRGGGRGQILKNPPRPRIFASLSDFLEMLEGVYPYWEIVDLLGFLCF